MRIIKESVRTAIKDVVFRNKQRQSYVAPTPGQIPPATWHTERYMYPIRIPGGKEVVIEVRGDRVLTDLSTLPEECYGAILSRDEVYDAINKERDHQDDKWGPNKPQSLPGFLIILERELQEAKEAWLKNIEGDHAALNEIVQVAATAVACLEKYGVSGSATATNDIPQTNR